jgi:hypothetical protein
MQQHWQCYEYVRERRSRPLHVMLVIPMDEASEERSAVRIVLNQPDFLI